MKTPARRGARARRAAAGLALALCGASLAPALPAPGESGVRVLFDFEDPADLTALAAQSQGASFSRADDGGVTSGQHACRIVFERGGGYSQVHFTGDRRAGWQDYDYFAADVFVPGDERTDLTLEFWDAQTRDYATRCSLVAQVVPGRQTVLIPIARLKRNGKEGRDWEELEPGDKIDLRAVTKCKLFLTTPPGHDLIWFVDNIRLLKESALGLAMTVDLPPGAVAFHFGKGRPLPGLVSVPAGTAFDGTRGFTQSADLKDCGRNWPDALTGNGVYSPSGQPFEFEAKVPDGDYRIWVAAGPVLRREIRAPRFRLRVAGRTVVDEQPAIAELYGEKYFFRFMRTLYSERPNALWLDFIDRMYPVHEVTGVVTGGALRVEVSGLQLSALIAVPGNAAAAFDAMCAAIREERIRVFNASQPALAPAAPARPAGGGTPWLCFVPDDTSEVTPRTFPGAAGQVRKAYDLAAAPGQNLFFRLAATSFDGLGNCEVGVSDLRGGPVTIPGAPVRWYLQNHRRRGADVVEDALLPARTAPMEQGLTRCFWAWLRVPADAAPGGYTGRVTVAVGARSEDLPLRLTVHPFRLVDTLPYSFGLWYSAPDTPDAADRARVTAGQLAFMREIGLTGVTVGGPDANGDADPFLVDLAKAAGMGRHPLQFSLSSSLGMGRAIARQRLGLGARVDQRPGCEFEQPRFRSLFVASARRYAAFLRECGLPTAVQSVDEPREVPNPWNRNLEQTNLYGDFLAEAGIANRMVTPMGDAQGGKDYTSLVEHHDIVATHAGRASARLMAMTPERGKRLWLYNCGMDRLSWGFYNWRAGSSGRWEWHFRWADGGGMNGYLNDEWYNPFTTLAALAPEAPIATHDGAMLFRSAFFRCAEGITDTAYLVTLERALQTATDTSAAARARELLDEIRSAIPLLPDVQGLEGDGDGALVGQGLRTPAAARCEAWRRRIAGLLTELMPSDARQ